MKTKKTSKRDKIPADWDGVHRVYLKLLDWLYGREDRKAARPYADRLEMVLQKLDPNHEAIFGEECRSLIYETRGDFPRAIKHRENEIRLIRRLHEIAKDSPDPSFMLEAYGVQDLSDRLDLLATLYHDNGNLNKAIAVLQESKRLCKSEGIEFDGDDLLEDYLQEKRQTKEKSPKPGSAPKRRTA